MKIAGIILIVLQALALIGSLIGGKNPFDDGVFELFGYFIFGIIGIILLIVAYKKKNNQKPDNKNDKTDNNNTNR